MITSEDILNMNFYKKERFTGSYKGMRYRIQKDTLDEAEIFLAHVWPGPYNFDSTEDALKTSASFPFTEEGKEEMVAWLNLQWSALKDK